MPSTPSSTPRIFTSFSSIYYVFTILKENNCINHLDIDIFGASISRCHDLASDRFHFFSFVSPQCKHSAFFFGLFIVNESLNFFFFRKAILIVRIAHQWKLVIQTHEFKKHFQSISINTSSAVYPLITLFTTIEWSSLNIKPKKKKRDFHWFQCFIWCDLQITHSPSN